MEAFILYFNELSLPGVLGHDGHNKHDGLDGFIEAFDSVSRLRSECCLAFPAGSWNADCGGLPLVERLKQRLDREKYRLLLKRIKRLSNADIALEHEVKYCGHSTVGLALADLAAEKWGNGWVISLSLSPWLHPQVTAHRLVMNSRGELDGPEDCIIGNISNRDHAEKWKEHIQDWGARIASSSILDEIEGHPIAMYLFPLEHNPPHVHLLEGRNSHKTLAKFQIDEFARHQGPPDWDEAMKEWIRAHREELLRSWARCQRGKYPYELD